MPYIPRDKRAAAKYTPQDVGELTYALTMVLLRYLGRRPNRHFSDYAEVLGALEATKLELYRRCIEPHEDRKCLENGDVY